jgi:hypothetical protein
VLIASRRAAPVGDRPGGFALPRGDEGNGLPVVAMVGLLER